MNCDVSFILVRPRYPGNLGAAARALKNMGFSKLRLVQPKARKSHPEAQWMSVGAIHLLRKAEEFDTIEEAARDLQFLVGTSCRHGRKRGRFLSLSELHEELPPGRKVGILFGPEDKGLTTKELYLCHKIVRIPTHPRFSSINLAQSVMLIAYELSKGRNGHLLPTPPGLREETFASVDQIEGMYRHFEEMLGRIGFFPHQNPFSVMKKLRRIFTRTQLTAREVRMIRGICHQTLSYLSRPPITHNP